MLAQAVMPVVFVLERNHKPRDEKSLRQSKWLSPWIGQSRLESATVTESFWKRREWNAVNPSS